MERHQQIENVARAFYDAQDHAPLWETAPDHLKDEYRAYARDALFLLDSTPGGLAMQLGAISQTAHSLEFSSSWT